MQPREIPRVPDTVDGRRRALGFRTPVELNRYMMEQLYSTGPTLAPSPPRPSAPDATLRLRLGAEELWGKGLKQDMAIQTDNKVRYDVAVRRPLRL